MATEKPLRKIAEAFKELEEAVKSEIGEVEVASFTQASSLVSSLFGCLGIAFKFTQMDYVAKVLRVKRGIDMVKVLCEQIIVTKHVTSLQLAYKV